MCFMCMLYPEQTNSETESRLQLTRAGGGANGLSCLMGRVSVWGYEKAWKLIVMIDTHIVNVNSATES